MKLFWTQEDQDLWDNTKDMSDKELIDEVTQTVLDNFGEADIHAVANVLRMREGLSFDLTNAETKKAFQEGGRPLKGAFEAKA